ncbi:monovalent cation/H+ antiporter complex subunit F [Aeromicrobium sp. CTD01-1L150]|uniref:monovalent cation/H+ antiporter complex subunit F n=1 Tax=Aeromicrobium sp. CTD01-1L150 TaxID=3341830 RepID=UPI0035BFE2FE
MIGVDVAIVGITLAVLLAVWRIVVGPTPADRAVAADLLSFSVVALIALVGVRAQSTATLDLVLVATLVAFLAAVSLARALTRGWR